MASAPTARRKNNKSQWTSSRMACGRMAKSYVCSFSHFPRKCFRTCWGLAKWFSIQFGVRKREQRLCNTRSRSRRVYDAFREITRVSSNVMLCVSPFHLINRKIVNSSRSIFSTSRLKHNNNESTFGLNGGPESMRQSSRACIIRKLWPISGYII